MYRYGDTDTDITAIKKKKNSITIHHGNLMLWMNNDRLKLISLPALLTLSLHSHTYTNTHTCNKVSTFLAQKSLSAASGTSNMD